MLTHHPACVIGIILLLNVEFIRSKSKDDCVQLNGSYTCHSTDRHPYRYYGTKTSYRAAVRNHSHSNRELDRCTPKVLYLLSRHSTRYPDEEQIRDMLRILPPLRDQILNSSEDGKAAMCGEDIEKLRAWSEKLKPELGDRMSVSGALEAEGLGRRLKERFPMLNEPYSSERFVFEFTGKDRTRSTAIAFARGVFKDFDPMVLSNANINEDVLVFHKNCKRMQELCGNSSVDISEVEHFGNGPLMQKVVQSVSKRIGFPISLDDLKTVYKSCAFGYALHTNDVWCSLLSSEELKVLEYEQDIDDYYKDAYGNKINTDQACPVAKYIVNMFRSYENGTHNKIIFHFSHAGVVKKVYAMFGLFQDNDHLTSDTFCLRKERKWRSSLITPFNSNIFLVLYECDGENKIAAFHNEQLVHMSGCDSALCPIQQFYQFYEGIGRNCDIRKICFTCE